MEVVEIGIRETKGSEDFEFPMVEKLVRLLRIVKVKPKDEINITKKPSCQFILTSRTT